MKFSIVDRIRRGDALSNLNANAGDVHKYSEWHHFNFNDDANGLYGIFNLALSGNVENPEEGRAGISLVVYEKGEAWKGTMDLQPVEKVNFRPGSVDLNVGRHYVRLRKETYRIAGALKNQSVALKATWIPQLRGIRVSNIGGIINTFIIPRLTVEGSVWIDGHEYVLDGATGYHDHNWGYWDWGKDIGWDWGYIIQSPPARKNAPEPLTIVFGQVTDATRTTAKSDLVLMIWEGRECKQIFLDDAMEISTEGRLTGTEIRRVPGLMSLLYPGQSHATPELLRVVASDGDDHLEIDMEVESAIQFLVPHPTNTGNTVITELVGEYTVRGTLGGHTYDFSYVGFAEVAG